ncbi:hypothetical protein Indivirus_2_34 [Indivirus ILV1]|uniref:Uncharacterized protein n=1 Tax=Indivirus ILV1 TaxID=1977633 RepID=A0A1V0SD62_9VIRU|nr:hypothetical protein Indivirus_2_34 [Indivirus ILV1]
MDIINEYKTKIINAIDYDDAKSLINFAISIISNNETEIKILNSLLDKDRYTNKMEFKKFLSYLNIFNQITYKDDAEVLINDLESMINDNVQLNTLKRIIINKPQFTNKINNYTKSCPHCTKMYIGNDNTTYVVCGYTDKGYDWKGCSKDWCFKCGKKLCKSWNTDHLYNPLNRIHDTKCCKNYAAKIKSNYSYDFCQCVAEYNRRY